MSAWAPAALLAAIAAVVAIWPLGAVLLQVLRGVAAQGFGAVGGVPAATLFRTLAWTGGMSAAATILAWPAAWGARRLHARWALVLAVPMLMPSYLAYAGWGLLRAPGTPLGDWLLAGPNWRPVAAGRAIAVAGLVLWVWPLAMIVLLARFRRIDGAVLDAFRLEAGPARRAAGIAAMTRGASLAAAAVVMLVLLGSAVPLHLAQVETHAITLWRRLDETAADQHWRVWAAAWPLVLVAGAGAWVVAREIRGVEGSGEAWVDRARGASLARGRRLPGAALLAAALLWTASALAPAALFAGSLREFGSVPRFWRANSEAIATSAVVALAVGVLGSLIAACAWQAFASGGRRARLAAVCLGVLLLGALLPGVLVGSATAAAWNSLPAGRPVADSAAVVVLGQIARFAALAALAGWWLAATESTALGALWRLDGADTIGGWTATALPGGVGHLLGTGAAMAALSFHEIEATVMLQPPGSESFARVMLQNLHFARMEDLSAGAVLVIGLGLALAIGGALLFGRGRSGQRL